MDSSIVKFAIPRIISSLHASFGEAELTVASYALAFSLDDLGQQQTESARRRVDEGDVAEIKRRCWKRSSRPASVNPS